MVILEDEELVWNIKRRKEQEAIQLIESGCTLEPFEGKDPLHLSIDYGLTLVTLKLLQHGVPPGRRGEDNGWAFVTALENKNFVAADALLAYGFDINAKNPDRNGVTPLMEAYARIDNETLEYTLGKGADVNARDDNGSNLLIWAVNGFGDEKKIATLLRHGADPLARNKDGVNALDRFYSLYHVQPRGDLARLIEDAADKIIRNRTRLQQDIAPLKKLQINKNKPR